MTGEFHEDFVSPHLDPLDGEAVDFPWSELYRRLGEDDGVEEPLNSQEMERLVYALKKLLCWLIGQGSPNVEQIGKRTLGLAWVLCPGYIQGSPSLTKLAAQIGCLKQSLSQVTAAVHRDFGISNRAQRHGWNFKKGGPNA